ncbi:hypothetical protein GBA65_19355 [Rubrobacter marinus]|uniref:Uncharacterized protein n=1 Tax=Rubrobacter marinus TaxID=2653852 RepID=A0A6G8Q1M8_9ACTN|nr:hypothetical protein [Rubrobacter marinus]QIN80320.1 hypothetical protein GBA65_19355 [Rubrobacter marinus]
MLDRWVGEMAAPGETGETARRGVRAIIHAGAERYPRSLLASIPQGPEKDALCAELAGTAGR